MRRGQLTVKDNISYALYKWMLFSLSLEQFGQHTLVMIEYIVYVPEDFAEEAREFIRFDDRGVGVS